MPQVPKGMFKRQGRGWYCRVRRGNKDKWVALGKDFSEAVRRFHEVKLSMVVPSRVTIGQLASEWQRTYVPTARCQYNQSQSESRVRRFLLEFLGPVQAVRLGSEDLRNYRLWLEKKGLAPMTVKHVLSDVRCMLNWAVDAGYLDRSPFPKRLMPRMQERPPDRLTDEEVAALTAIAEPYGFVVRLALGTGMRWGELTRVQSSDIRDGVLTVHQTKSGKVRRVPVPPELQEELRRRVGRLVVFSSPGQLNTRVRILSQVWRFHMHQCRHTFSCRWVERGGSLAALQQMLGHSTIVMTQRYARISDELVKAEADRVYSVATTVAMPNGPSRKVEVAQ